MAILKDKVAIVTGAGQGIGRGIAAAFAKEGAAVALVEINPASAVASQALKRLGDCEADIGRLAVFLAGPDASYITGATIPANGGAYLSP